MRILVNGCSFSRGPCSWPTHIASLLSADLVNLAQAGAGNIYISQTTQAELTEREYDLVLIMWSGLERVDLQVENISQFNDTPYTSFYQSKKNDWPEKVIFPINDQNYVQKDWVFGVGHINCDPFLVNNGLFTNQYKYQGFNQHLQRSLYNMISLQNFCKVKNIPYAFAFYHDYVHQFKKYPALSSQLDWSYIYNKINLFDIAQQISNFDIDGIHPGHIAHKQWAEHFYKFLKND